MSRVIFLFFRAFADSVFLTVLLAGMDISRPMNGISFPFCGYDFDGLDGILSGISCMQKKNGWLPTRLFFLFLLFPFYLYGYSSRRFDLYPTTSTFAYISPSA